MLYMGKVFIPESSNEDAEIIQGIHEALITETLFNKVQKIIKGKTTSNKKHYEKLDESAPLRGMLSCPSVEIN